MTTALYLQNALVPQNRQIMDVAPARITDLAPHHWQTPYVCFVDGRPVLRADWELVVDGQVVFIDVHALPQGGGGSNPLRTILMIAVMIYAPQLGALMGPSLTGTAVLGLSASTWTAGFMFAGMALVNAIAPPPKPTSAAQAASLAAPSPTYSLQAQGNSARLEAAIPEHFGYMVAYPDFAAQPYAEFSGNEQYLYQLLCIGRGAYEISAIRVEDTPITSFEDITYEVIQPGGTLTLFPSAVVTSVEVAGQELLTSAVIGPFVALVSGTQANYLGVDFVCGRGLYYANDDGSLGTVSVSVLIEAQLINDAGTAIGGWTTLATKTYTAATTTPQRYSERFAVTPGRYQVRATRTDTKQTGTRYGHEISWAGLRAYLPDTRAFGDVTLLAMRLKASNNLSMQASRKINVLCTRTLPVWNGSSWSGLTATRSPAWALAYACKQVGLSDAQIDLAGLLTLATTCASRGDTFDARFDNFLTWWESATKIAQSVRAKPYMQGGVVRVVRDQAATLPVALFSQRNIVKGSFSVNYLMPTDDTADSVDVKYFDGITWNQSTVRATLAGSTALKPAKIDLFGVTARAQAHREGLYQAACNRYRRKIISFTTEMEGFIPSFGDLIAIQHDMPAWGQSGEAVAWVVGTLTLTLSEPMVFTTGTHYLALRRRDGSVSGPYVVTAGGSANQVVLATAPDFTPYTGAAEERTHCAFGPSTTWRQPARVLSAKPQSLTQVQIEAVNEDDSVHSADTGVTMPVQVFNQLAKYTNAPAVLGLIAKPLQSENSLDRVVLSWQSSPWADHYVIEQSGGDGVWTRCGETGTSSYVATMIFKAGSLLRVAAVGVARGPWAVISSGWESNPPDVVNFNIAGDKLNWSSVVAVGMAGYEIRFAYGASINWAAAAKLHLGILTDGPYVMKKRPEGQITLMIKAIDKVGNYSVNAASIGTAFGSQVVSNLFVSAPEAPLFANGTLTGGTVVGGALTANALDQFFSPGTDLMFKSDTDPFYPAGLYAAMTYTWSFTPPSVAGTVLLDKTVVADSYTMEYQRQAQAPAFLPATDYLFSPPTDLMYGAAGAWETWPGSLDIVAAESLLFRITAGGGPTQGVISAATPKLDVPDVLENFNDLVVSASGSRLPITKTYRVIQNVQITVQADGNGGVTAVIVDKSATLGPLIKVYNAAGSAVVGSVDADIQGY